ncbi:MAG: Ig-like domain-containing protein, partial [Planctomycetota bacterium]
TSFGTDGLSVIDVGAGGGDSDDTLADLLVLPGDRILLGGRAATAGNYYAAMVRLTADGALDTGWGAAGAKTGIRVLPDADDDKYARGLTTDGQGRVLMVAKKDARVAVFRFVADDGDHDGELDTSFGGGDGIATFRWSSDRRGLNESVDVLVADDDSLYVVGDFDRRSDARGDLNWAVCRLDAAGEVVSGWGTGSSLDNTADDGQVSMDWGSAGYGGASLGSAVLQSDGKLVLAGWGRNDIDDSRPTLVRLQADGSLDSGFGSGGQLALPVDAPDYNLTGVALALDENDGRELVVGLGSDAGTTSPVMLQVGDGGSLDNGFAGDGLSVVPVQKNAEDEAMDVISDAQGRQLIVGRSGRAGQWLASVARLLPDGRPDTSFNLTGSTSLALDPERAGTDVAHGICEQADGRLLVVGNGRADDARQPSAIGYSRGMLARLHSDGSIDTGFGANGRVVIGTGGDYVGDWVTLYDVAVDGDGLIYVVGQQYSSNNRDIVVRCFDQEGSPVSSFGDGGVVIIDGAENGSFFADDGRCIAIDSQGRILVGGGLDELNADVQPVVMRLDRDGQPDESFGADGRLVFLSADEHGIVMDLQVRSDDSVIAVGLASRQATAWLLEEDGSLASGFPISFDADGSDDQWELFTGVVAAEGGFIASGSTAEPITLDALGALSAGFTGSGTPLPGYGSAGLQVYTDPRLASGVGLAAGSGGTYGYLAGTADLDLRLARIALSDAPPAAAPVIAQGDSVDVAMDEDGSPTAFDLVLDASDADTDDADLRWSIGAEPANGRAAVASGSGAQQRITYTPDADYHGSDSFRVTVSDGLATDSITVDVSIAAQPEDPTGTPEIRLNVGGTDLADGGSVTGPALDLDATTQATITITIHNDGTGNLLLQPVEILGQSNCLVDVVTAAATGVAPGNSTDLVLRVASQTAGAYSCQLQMATNDADENPTTWSITGTTSAETLPGRAILLRLRPLALLESYGFGLNQGTPLGGSVQVDDSAERSVFSNLRTNTNALFDILPSSPD